MTDPDKNCINHGWMMHRDEVDDPIERVCKDDPDVVGM